MDFVLTDKAPKPGGHYSQAVVHNGVVYVAGQLPIVPGSDDRTPGPLEVQVRQALVNMLAVVEAAGSRPDLVIKVTIYVADMEAWGLVNGIFAELFGSHKPARAIVPCPPLHYGYGIEVDCIAALA